MEPGKSEFSLPRAFHWWSRNCRNPSGSLANQFFVCVWLIGNSAVKGHIWSTVADTDLPQRMTAIMVGAAVAVDGCCQGQCSCCGVSHYQVRLRNHRNCSRGHRPQQTVPRKNRRDRNGDVRDRGQRQWNDIAKMTAIWGHGQVIARILQYWNHLRDRN